VSLPEVHADGTKARPCTKAHGSWSYKHGALDGAGHRQVELTRCVDTSLLRPEVQATTSVRVRGGLLITADILIADAPGDADATVVPGDVTCAIEQCPAVID